jgi:class 3 adenylate cyclase
MGQDMSQQRRLAAIMFTDMVGYSALSQRNEALALALLNEHRKILRELLAPTAGARSRPWGTASSSNAQALWLRLSDGPWVDNKNNRTARQRNAEWG